MDKYGPMGEIEKEGEYQGLTYVIRRNYVHGKYYERNPELDFTGPLSWRCGYVLIEDPHNVFYEKNYSDFEYPPVHGGITFTGFCDDYRNLFGNLEGWVIGFDCNHYMDTEEEWTLERVEEEIKEFIDELLQIEDAMEEFNE